MLVYGAVDGVTLAVLLAVIASVLALPSAWCFLDWARTLPLLGAGLLAAPLGVLMTRALPEPALLFAIGGMAVVALLGPRLSSPAAALLRGRGGALVAGAAAGFMHSSSGLSGPALAAYAITDGWEQRRFAASAQVIFLGYGLISVLLRGLPVTPAWEVAVLALCTGAGIIGGAALVRRIPAAVARAVMLWCAWLGALVVLVRAVVALAVPS